jgi:hypothetical protein
VRELSSPRSNASCWIAFGSRTRSKRGWRVRLPGGLVQPASRHSALANRQLRTPAAIRPQARKRPPVCGNRGNSSSRSTADYPAVAFDARRVKVRSHGLVVELADTTDSKGAAGTESPCATRVFAVPVTPDLAVRGLFGWCFGHSRGHSVGHRGTCGSLVRTPCVPNPSRRTLGPTSPAAASHLPGSDEVKLRSVKPGEGTFDGDQESGDWACGAEEMRRLKQLEDENRRLKGAGR